MFKLKQFALRKEGIFVINIEESKGGEEIMTYFNHNHKLREGRGNTDAYFMHALTFDATKNQVSVPRRILIHIFHLC